MPKKRKYSANIDDKKPLSAEGGFVFELRRRGISNALRKKRKSKNEGDMNDRDDNRRHSGIAL